MNTTEPTYGKRKTAAFLYGTYFYCMDWPFYFSNAFWSLCHRFTNGTTTEHAKSLHCCSIVSMSTFMDRVLLQEFPFSDAWMHHFFVNKMVMDKCVNLIRMYQTGRDMRKTFLRHEQEFPFLVVTRSFIFHSKVTGSEIAHTLKPPTSSNVHYVFMFLFHNFQQCTNNVHFRKWVILEPYAISTSKFYI